MESQHIFIKIISFFVWLSGFFVLAVKGWQHLHAASLNGISVLWTASSALLILAAGFAIGVFVLSPACRSNLNRIEKIEDPGVHQAFSPGLLLFLILLMAVGMIFSRWASGSAAAELGAGIYDWSIAVGIAVSVREFLINMDPENREEKNA